MFAIFSGAFNAIKFVPCIEFSYIAIFPPDEVLFFNSSADVFIVTFPVPLVNTNPVAPVALPIVIVLATAPVPIFTGLDAVVFVPIFIAPDDVFKFIAASPTVKLSEGIDVTATSVHDKLPAPSVFNI